MLIAKMVIVISGEDFKYNDQLQRLCMNSFVVTVINEETFAKTWYVETCCAD